jgi:LysR substrate binding domain
MTRRGVRADIRLEVIAEESFVDVLAAGCDAGIRYGERLEQDMIAVPIGPRQQRFSLGAAPAYLDRRGRPEHPRDLLGHTWWQCFAGPYLYYPGRRLVPAPLRAFVDFIKVSATKFSVSRNAWANGKNGSC